MKGQRIIVAGKVVVPRSKRPSWLALKRPDGKVGYVVGAALVAMIDGALKTPLRGKLSRVTGEDFLTITALYDPNTKRVSFDRVNDDKMRTPALIPPEPESPSSN